MWHIEPQHTWSARPRGCLRQSLWHGQPPAVRYLPRGRGQQSATHARHPTQAPTPGIWGCVRVRCITSLFHSALNIESNLDSYFVVRDRALNYKKRPQIRYYKCHTPIPVVSILRMSLVTVPDLRRVEPVTTSGPACDWLKRALEAICCIFTGRERFWRAICCILIGGERVRGYWVFSRIGGDA